MVEKIRAQKDLENIRILGKAYTAHRTSSERLIPLLNLRGKPEGHLI